MSTVQEIFRRVIRRGCYNNANYDGSEYMCWALSHAYESDIITRDEFYDARRAIDEYLTELGAPGNTMLNALREAGLESSDACLTADWAPVHGKDFYWNWDARPRP